MLLLSWTHNTCLFQEGRVHPQVLGHHIEAEEVPVDTLSRHGMAIHTLVLISCQPKQLQFLFILGFGHREEKKETID